MIDKIQHQAASILWQYTVMNSSGTILMSILPETLAMSTKYIFPFSFSHIMFSYLWKKPQHCECLWKSQLTIYKPHVQRSRTTVGGWRVSLHYRLADLVTLRLAVSSHAVCLQLCQRDCQVDRSTCVLTSVRNYKFYLQDMDNWKEENMAHFSIYSLGTF